MGSCTSGRTSSTKSRVFQLPPEDILCHDPSEAHTLDFQANLSNVRLENLSTSLHKNPLSLEFKIPGIITIDCPAAPVVGSTLKWPTNVSFSFANNEYEIRFKFLLVSIRDKTGKVISELKINLYRIMCGPFHHDFFMGKKDHAHGRLIFDLKIEQIVIFSLESQSAQIEFCKEYPGEKFNFVIQSQNKTVDKSFSAFGPIATQNKSFKTIPSYSKEIPLQKTDKFREISALDEAPSPTYRLRRTATNMIKAATPSSLSWSKNQKPQMPGIRLKLKATQIYSSSFGFKLCKLLEDSKNIVEFGYYTLTLSQLLSFDPQRSETKNIGQKRLIEVQKKLWQNGKNVAKCQLKLILENNKFIKQMPSHTQTEDGIINMSFYESYKGKENTQDDQKISELQQNYNKIVEIVKQKALKSTFLERARLNAGLTQQLEELSEILTKTIKNSYTYHSEENMKKLQNKQCLLVNILKILSCLIEQQDLQMGDLCWKSVIQIMKRGELMLRYWSYCQKQIKQIQQGQQCSETKKKIELGFELWKTMNKLLKLALDIEPNCKNQKQNSQVFKAYCYFRVPLFREKILSVLKQGNTEDAISQQFIFSSKMDTSEGSSKQEKEKRKIYLMKEIDWVGRFYRILQLKGQKAVLLHEDLKKYLEHHHWFQRLSAKDEVFFNFVRFLMAKLTGIRTLHKTPNVYYFIGYQRIVNTYIMALKARDINEYSSFMMLAGMSLLENQTLFPTILTIIYEKTNIYDQTSVIRMLGILSHFLDSVFTKGKAVNFPYQYFMTNLKVMLKNVHCSISVSQTLNLLYNFYDCFELNFRYELSAFLLGNSFWKFFYHWSYNVRRTYYHIVLLRIAQDQHLLKTTDTKNRLDEVLTIVQNFQEKTETMIQQKSKKISTVERVLHKRMKEKILQRKSKGKSGEKLKSGEKRPKTINLGGRNSEIRLEFTYQMMAQPNVVKKTKIQIPANKKKAVSKLEKNLGPTTTTHLMQKNSRVRTEHDINNQNEEDKENKGAIDLMNHDGSTCHSSQYDICDLTQLKLNKKASFKSCQDHIFTYGCFTKQQLSLGLNQSEIKKCGDYSILATRQFKEIIKLLEEHVEEKDILPEVQLGFKVEFDEKEILPAGFDISLVA